MGITVCYEYIAHWHTTETPILRPLFKGHMLSVSHVNITRASPIIFSWGTHQCHTHEPCSTLTWTLRRVVIERAMRAKRCRCAGDATSQSHYFLPLADKGLGVFPEPQAVGVHRYVSYYNVKRSSSTRLPNAATCYTMLRHCARVTKHVPLQWSLQQYCHIASCSMDLSIMV